MGPIGEVFRVASMTTEMPQPKKKSRKNTDENNNASGKWFRLFKKSSSGFSMLQEPSGKKDSYADAKKNRLTRTF